MSRTRKKLREIEVLDKPIIDVQEDDAVRVANGGTGVVKYVGTIDVIGILMDQWHPSYGNGTIDGKQYFKSDDGRGYFAHPPEINENLGSTRKTKAPMAPMAPMPNVGDTVHLKDGKRGVVKYIGTPEFSDGQKMVGVELANWSTNTSSGTVNDKAYFESNPGRGYFARLQSISVADWKVPTDLVEEAKRLNEDEANNGEDSIDNAQTKDGKELAVNLGDRIVTVSGYTGVVRFKGRVHFDEREVIGIELDQWSPNGHNGIIHLHKYFSCTEGRGYFIRPNGIEKNMGPTRRRRKSRTVSMMDFGLITKNLKIGDHIKLVRGKTGVVKYLGKSSDINEDDSNTQDIVGIELDEWSANGNDGKNLFKTSKGRGYFARRASVATLKADINEGKNMYNTLDEEYTGMKQKHKHLMSEGKILAEENNNYKETIDDLTTKNVEYNAYIQSNDLLIQYMREESKKQQQQHKEQYYTMQKGMDTLRDERRKLKIRMAENEKTTSNFTQSLDTAHTIQSKLQKQLEETQLKYTQIVQKHEEKHDETLAENKRFKERIYALENEQKQYEIEINTLKTENQELKEKLIDESRYKEWNYEKILMWILSLEHGRYSKYENVLRNNLKEEQVIGDYLNDVNEFDVKGWGITNFSDKKSLAQQIQRLVHINKNIIVTEGNNVPTAYI